MQKRTGVSENLDTEFQISSLSSSSPKTEQIGVDEQSTTGKFLSSLYVYQRFGNSGTYKLFYHLIIYSSIGPTEKIVQIQRSKRYSFIAVTQVPFWIKICFKLIFC